MSYLVVGKKVDSQWDLEVQGVGTTHAADLAGIEPAVRALLAREDKPDAADADLQLLMPDFEVDLSEQRVPRTNDRPPYVELVSGFIALLVVIGAIVYVVTSLAASPV